VPAVKFGTGYDADLYPCTTDHERGFENKMDCAVSFEQRITCGPELTEKPNITYVYRQNSCCRANGGGSQINQDYRDRGRIGGQFPVINERWIFSFLYFLKLVPFVPQCLQITFLIISTPS
jgi:hypothetical protein